MCFPDPTVKIESTTMTPPPSNIPHYDVHCTHTQCGSIFSEETIAWNDVEKIRRDRFCRCSQQSQFSPTIQNNSVFILHLKVECVNSFNFLRLESKAKLSVCSIFSVGDKSRPLVLFSQLKTISDMKGDVLCLKMYIKWCQQHPRGQSRVPMETESGCCAWRLDIPPPFPQSGGSVMALNFSRHVPGSFDTGNMHAGWQCLGCAAETMMYISFSSLTDWRL